MDLGDVQVLDETHRKFHNRCKFCERRFDSSGEMGRHIGYKHTREGEAFNSMNDLVLGSPDLIWSLMLL